MEEGANLQTFYLLSSLRLSSSPALVTMSVLTVQSQSLAHLPAAVGASVHGPHRRRYVHTSVEERRRLVGDSGERGEGVQKGEGCEGGRREERAKSVGLC